MGTLATGTIADGPRVVAGSSAAVSTEASRLVVALLLGELEFGLVVEVRGWDRAALRERRVPLVRVVDVPRVDAEALFGHARVSRLVAGASSSELVVSLVDALVGDFIREVRVEELTALRAILTAVS